MREKTKKTKFSVYSNIMIYTYWCGVWRFQHTDTLKKTMSFLQYFSERDENNKWIDLLNTIVDTNIHADLFVDISNWG